MAMISPSRMNGLPLVASVAAMSGNERVMSLRSRENRRAVPSKAWAWQRMPSCLSSAHAPAGMPPCHEAIREVTAAGEGSGEASMTRRGWKGAMAA